VTAFRGRLLLYAPNVHTGGGAVLLELLLAAWPDDLLLVAWLDVRIRKRIHLPVKCSVSWVSPNVGSRLWAEVSLANAATGNDRILCFHGLPPLLRNKAESLIFQQNRNYLGLVPLRSFAWRTRQRLRFEQTVAFAFRRRCSGYFVQTHSMASALRRWYGDDSVKVNVLPFWTPTTWHSVPDTPQRDFIYVADGEAHKNHRNLIEAWVLLSKQSIFPSLAVTLSQRDAGLVSWISQKIDEFGLNVVNLGHISHESVMIEYDRSRALVFPSLSESFGLPLIEAHDRGLKIVASELDFVRDVCVPVETFDPYSPVSIARAIMRFIGHEETLVKPISASAFLGVLLEGMP
jgi:hypothetical protein